MKKVKLGEYYIIFERRPAISFAGLSCHKYICNLVILNNLNIPLLNINVSEQDIALLIEDIYSFLEDPDRYNYSQSMFNFTNLKLMGFGIIFQRKVNDYDNILMKVIEYEPYINNLYNQRLVIEFEELGENKYNLCDFCTDLYDIFLGDIKEYYYLDPGFVN